MHFKKTVKHLLLLHGALGHPGYFDFIKEALAAEYLIHTPVFEGHTGFRQGDVTLSMAAYVAQIEKYCEEHDLEQVAIFGYSMGGYVGLCYAAQFPERVTDVMTLATKLSWSPEIAEREVKMLDPVTIKEKVPKFAAYLGSVHGSAHWEKLCRDIAGLLTGLGEHPLLGEQEYAAIKAKTQLMVGDKDNMVSIEETMTTVKQIEQANFAVLPDTIHPFEKINRELLLRLMRDFFTTKQ